MANYPIGVLMILKLMQTNSIHSKKNKIHILEIKNKVEEKNVNDENI